MSPRRTEKHSGTTSADVVWASKRDEAGGAEPREDLGWELGVSREAGGAAHCCHLRFPRCPHLLSPSAISRQQKEDKGSGEALCSPLQGQVQNDASGSPQRHLPQAQRHLWMPVTW